MLEVNFIREQKAKVRRGLMIRNFMEDELEIIDEIIRIDDQRKATQTKLNDKQAENKRLSKKIGQLFKEGKTQEAESIRERVRELKENTLRLEEEKKSLEQQLEGALLDVPNIPHDSVDPGIDQGKNKTVKDWGKEFPELAEGSLDHLDLGKKYNLFDLELGVKITGAGFPVYRGRGARLERALISFFLDEANKAGYEEIIPPLLVNEATARATGQLPDKEGQMYYVERDDLYLIPTAEVPVTNIYRGVILTEDQFPIKLTGYTPCFRREAGSYGKEVRGLNRVHQFDKVEIVQIVHPRKSYEVLDEMVAYVESLLVKLGLPYRIQRLCGGDLGFTSALTFDFEVYSAAQKRWLEVSSVSNFETFQSNRMKLRYRDGKSTRLAHTLNGSALALARIVAALLENNQTPEGIVIPKVLQDYTRFEMIS